MTGAVEVDVMAAGVRWSRRLVVVTLVLSLAAAGLTDAEHDIFVLVLVTAGLLAGLPHGSVDHRLAASLTGWPLPLVATAYAGVAALTWVLLATTGPVALVAVLGLSLVHFALGETEVLRATTSWRPARAVSVAVSIAGTGALLLPLARSGDQLSAVAASISPELGGLLAAWPARVALVVAWTGAAALVVVAATRARQRAVVLDVVLIGALGALAPPLVSFAVWFGGWHALRHCARLLCVDPRSAVLVQSGQLRRAVGGLVRVAVGPTLVAVLVLAALLVATITSADVPGAIASTLLVLLALTVPHMVVVVGMDRWTTAKN